jgi:hypothetical protein
MHTSSLRTKRSNPQRDRFVAALLAMTHMPVIAMTQTNVIAMIHTTVIASHYVISSHSVIASEAKQSTVGSLRRCAPRDDLQFSITPK